jgi:hypothetical protein
MNSVLKYVMNFCNIIKQVKDISKTNKIITFIKGLHLIMQTEIDYHIPKRLEEAIKMVINYDNAHFHKLSTLKAITKTSQKKNVLYTYLYTWKCLLMKL